VDATVLRERRREAYESARDEILQRVPPTARRILDLGCASGALGAALKRRDQTTEIIGIEILPEYATDAEQTLDRVIRADVTDGLARDDLGTFDCIVAADVLEHLVNPWEAVGRMTELLDPGGTVVVSLPNVQYLKTFLTLAGGRWPRQDAGLFDRTHLRWFTFTEAAAMLTEAGLEITSQAGSYWFKGRVTLPAARWLGAHGLAGFLAGQLLLTARKPVPPAA